MTGVLLLALLSAPAVDWDLSPTLPIESTSTAAWALVQGPCPNGICPLSRVVPAEPAPPPSSEIYEVNLADTGGSTDVQVQATVVPRGDACDPPVTTDAGVYARQAVIVQRGPVLQYVSRGPVRGIIRRMVGNICARVQARRAARQARWAARRGEGMVVTAWSDDGSGDACTSARW